MQNRSESAEALKAYQAMLERHGYGRTEIIKHLHIARCILGALTTDASGSVNYRGAVDLVLDSMPDTAATDLCRRAARQFFPFFAKDFQAIALLSQSGVFETTRVEVSLPAHGNLDDLVRLAHARVLGEAEHLAVGDYVSALLSQGINPQGVSNRTSIALLLLLGMNGLERDGRHFRAVVDRLLPLFSSQQARDYFLAVAREFYGFMLGEPQATVILTQDISIAEAGW